MGFKAGPGGGVLLAHVLVSIAQGDRVVLQKMRHQTQHSGFAETRDVDTRAIALLAEHKMMVLFAGADGDDDWVLLVGLVARFRNVIPGSAQCLHGLLHHGFRSADFDVIDMEFLQDSSFGNGTSCMRWFECKSYVLREVAEDPEEKNLMCSEEQMRFCGELELKLRADAQRSSLLQRY